MPRRESTPPRLPGRRAPATRPAGDAGARGSYAMTGNRSRRLAAAGTAASAVDSVAPEAETATVASSP